jgi:hypothetical protein
LAIKGAGREWRVAKAVEAKRLLREAALRNDEMMATIVKRSKLRTWSRLFDGCTSTQPHLYP